ncbi:hypothetical protein RSOLAG1IB_04629 [Rhizoctonia solani AG-1 IB]|uniref:Uncharacterized protein n=1 Tax=Thanatephorus cucumeris (strain AG1-IB / isolate 7/3/14) TaxID=1108050 RepID=A0A0B7FYD1_THACB|nr:hypothetical protein RSOLAG1IB_04629 [Rhizoctonia solani AG-1 IB]
MSHNRGASRMDSTLGTVGSQISRYVTHMTPGHHEKLPTSQHRVAPDCWTGCKRRVTQLRLYRRLGNLND